MTTPQAEIGFDLSVFAGLAGSLGRVADMMERRENRRARLYESLHEITLAPGQIPLTAGAGVLDVPELLGPKTGYMWDIKRLTCSGFSAGTITVYKNGVVSASGTTVTAGTVFVPFAQSGTNTFGKGQGFLHPGDRLIFVAASITGTVQVDGVANLFESWLLPEYIG